MNSEKKSIRCGYLSIFTAGVLIGWSIQALPALPQEETVTIPNTATANFRSTPNGPLLPTTSNTTPVTARPIQGGLTIDKTADRAAAEPGDTVIYRLLVRNTGNTTLTGIQVTDTLPLGLSFLSNSVRASVNAGSGETAVNLSPTSVNGRTVTFTYPGTLEPRQTLTIVYGAVLTPDSIRGNGRNVASAASGPIRSNTATYQVQIRPGILSDCGTIVGRVFVDKNFDGEQQPGEPGVPNAVIFMDDGNRITTDANGLFSLAYVIAGYRTGTLDLSSLPGYTLAPNRYRIEANSQSRLVRLAPGGMGRMNFAVTPSFKEGQR